jgi:hypothetical protein
MTPPSRRSPHPARRRQMRPAQPSTARRIKLTTGARCSSSTPEPISPFVPPAAPAPSCARPCLPRGRHSRLHDHRRCFAPQQFRCPPRPRPSLLLLFQGALPAHYRAIGVSTELGIFTSFGQFLVRRWLEDKDERSVILSLRYKPRAARSVRQQACTAEWDEAFRLKC